ncbi:MAG: TetR/AcrR family transcriptional regulator [Armatimonadota bacterium]
MSKIPAPEITDARDRILRAAEKLFARKGYAATSVHEITNAAEVNRALLYYYFEDKHALYMALIDEGVAHFRQMLKRALASPGSYSDRLAAFVRGHLELIRTRPDHARMVHRCLLDRHQEEFGLVEKFQANVQVIEAFFREAVEAGEFDVDRPELAARTLLGPTFVYSLWRVYEGDRFTPEELERHVTSLLLRGWQRHD